MNKYALVTGASSGLGVEFAKILAKQGYGLILVARRLERLQSLKEIIQKECDVPVEIISQDLSVMDAADKLFAIVQRQNLDVEVLVNNAGFGLREDFLDNDPKRLGDMILLNAHTLTQLTLVFGKSFVQKQRGFILQVSSIAAFNPTPKMAVYSATKSYVQSFAQAVAHELGPHNVFVTSLCPGMTLTEFFDVAGQVVPPEFLRFGMSARSVAEIGLSAMWKKRRSVTAGFTNRLNMFLMRFLPMRLRVAIVAKVMQKLSA